MTYDPDPRRKRKGKSKRGRVPPQLRAWVFGRRTHDPRRKSMAYGYGSVSGKPYRKGSRGGVAWSGRRKLRRYDPSPRYGNFKRKGRDFMGKVASKFDTIGTLLGFALTFGGTTYAVYNYIRSHYSIPNFEENPLVAVNEMVVKEAQVFASDPLGHLNRKFLGENHWKAPFWGSLGLYLVSKGLSYFGYFGKINRFLKPLSRGMLIGSFIGALFVHGAYQGGNSTTHKDIMPTTSAMEMAYYG